MKPTAINVQITKCPKQYEAVRLGLDATLEPNETVEDAIKAATVQLNALYEEMYQQKPKAAQTGENAATKAPEKPAEEKPKTEDGAPKQRERLTFEDKRLQQIVRRMEKNPSKKEEILKEALKWFDPDENAMKILELAVKTI